MLHKQEKTTAFSGEIISRGAALNVCHLRKTLIQPKFSRRIWPRDRARRCSLLDVGSVCLLTIEGQSQPRQTVYTLRIPAPTDTGSICAAAEVSRKMYPLFISQIGPECTFCTFLLPEQLGRSFSLPAVKRKKGFKKKEKKEESWRDKRASGVVHRPRPLPYEQPGR